MAREKIELEYLFRASPAILYTFFTTPSNLVRWFCDEVEIEDETYIFSWEGAEEEADLVEDVQDERLRFKWVDADDEDEYLEIRFSKSEVTNQTILEITDFADDDEVSDQKQLWENQIAKLRQETGS